MPCVTECKIAARNPRQGPASAKRTAEFAAQCIDVALVLLDRLAVCGLTPGALEQLLFGRELLQQDLPLPRSCRRTFAGRLTRETRRFGKPSDRRV